MTYAAVEVVAHCKYAVGNTVLCLLGHVGVSQGAGGLSFPVFKRLMQLCRRIFWYLEGVSHSGAHCLKFLLNPVIRKFRTNLC